MSVTALPSRGGPRKSSPESHDLLGCVRQHSFLDPDESSRMYTSLVSLVSRTVTGGHQSDPLPPEQELLSPSTRDDKDLSRLCLGKKFIACLRGDDELCLVTIHSPSVPGPGPRPLTPRARFCLRSDRYSRSSSSGGSFDRDQVAAPRGCPSSVVRVTGARDERSGTV